MSLPRAKKKKIVLVLAVLLTSAAALSLILATSRYIGFIQHPEVWEQRSIFQVVPPQLKSAGITVRVASLGGETDKVPPLLGSIFWIFEVVVDNHGDAPVDADFDRVTLRAGEREFRALDTQAVLRLFNERMTGAYATAAGRRGHREALDKLQGVRLGVSRVFPDYTRRSLVFFQPHPEMSGEVLLTLHSIRSVRGEQLAPLRFRLLRAGEVESLEE